MFIIQKGEYIHLGSAVPSDEDAAARHEILTLKLKEMGIIEGNPIERNGSFIYRSKKNSQIIESKNNIYFIGEAAGLISPSSAEGISYALKSGRKLAEAFEKGSNIDKAYSKSIRSLRFNLIYKRLKSIIMYNKFLRIIIMLSGIISIRVEEDKE
jgi:flavin-dependent dehydrogenase